MIKEYITSYPEEVNKVNEYKWTALQLASQNSDCLSSIEIVKLLLEHNANINATNDHQWTALMYASDNLKRDIDSSRTGTSLNVLKLLLEYDAIPNGKFPEFKNNIKLLNVLS